MSYRLLNRTTPKGRRTYRCIWCGEDIPAGEQHIHEISVFDGNFQDHRWHPECEAAAQECWDGWDSEFLPWSNPRGDWSR